ncbi:unnamed protein product [Symbiodinium necroappetens]|uniref:EF-hand domain-containing protein n=1 Tax=Symbiodinium necroappetens TaxID=1628268 RepID=A0A812MJA6_9DINO|nr:unnamed protein product [Symbiodinium necroappetens]
MNVHIITVALAASIGGAASAQSFNVEWGTPGTAPDASYAAQGLPGVWNTFDAMPNGTRFPLVGLDGQPIAADIANIGFDVVESADIPGTTGGDEALYDDCFTSFNDPIDGCIFMRFLEPGEYEVILYGIAPDDEALLSPLRIDQNTEGEEFVGGAWPGTHSDGITYMSQRATVGADGRLDYHSGTFGGNFRSVLNGMQVVKLSEVCAGDCDLNGTVDFNDLVSMLFEFGSESIFCDADGNEAVDFNDLVAALFLFGPCP